MHTSEGMVLPVQTTSVKCVSVCMPSFVRIFLMFVLNGG